MRSSRRLEAEARRNIEVIWLVRHLKPDFKTIADFRRDNRAAFRAVFREFVGSCRGLDLFGRELVAVDGTRIKAVNNKDRNFTRGALTTRVREADEKLAKYMGRLDAGDADEEPASSGIGMDRDGGKLAEKIAAIGARRDRHRALLADLDRTGEDPISLTDPDARAMARMTKVGVGYNVQIAVDVKHHLIAEQEVCNQVLDLGLLAPTTVAAMAALGVERIEAVADRGTFKIEDLEACEKAGVTAYVPKPIRGPAVGKGFFSKEMFRYDPERDVFTCPSGQTLSPRHWGRSRANAARSTTATGTPAKPAPSSGPLHWPSVPAGVAAGERGRARPRGTARLAARPGILEQRRQSAVSPLRHDQAVDEPGRVPDASARERARRVQPHGAGLQHPTRHHLGRHPQIDRRRPRA